MRRSTNYEIVHVHMKKSNGKAAVILEHPKVLS